MMTLSASINRHFVGVSALLALLAILAYTANTATPRRVASLPEAGFAIAQQAPTETTPSNDTNFTPQLRQIPLNAYGSARGSEESLGEKIKSGIRAVVPSMGSNSAQTDAKNWSDEEWQIAEKAVADSRSNSNARNSTNASARANSNTVWQPPEEITGSQANPSR
ncbi:hypothetical protein WOC76_13345 [Methylocystis sp. IM3]|uniref:hypothetical protein n=1 Tax=unclassified Methylocystis TaxID=2625913 RepID=UPI0030FA2AF7